MRGSEAVERYRLLALTVSRMVELARGHRWALLPMLDAECMDLFHQLRDADAIAFSPAQLAHVQALASRIRCDQELLNQLVRPQFVELVQGLREAQRRPDAH